MKYSSFFPKTNKREFKDDLSVNAVLLVKAGYVDQLMAGSYTLLPLGLRVVENIKNIIREELNATGAQEMLMPLLHPREIWDQTGRWSDAGVEQIMYQFKDIHGKEYGLSFTHEEIVMHTLGKYVQSYKDLPAKIYQFSTKFRNEPRAKSGVLRGREFIMKDLYSAHVSEEDMYIYYHQVKEVYPKIFERMGMDSITVEASGGVFTDKNSHEFQVISEVGEDTIFTGTEGDKCPQCDDGCIIKAANSIEVGNIFPLGTKYSEKMNVLYTDREGNRKPIWFASYGIGPTRIMGTLVELFHDDRGIIWPENISPFKVYLVSLGKEEEAIEIEKMLEKAGISVLFDDRDASAGEKFANADLLGFPYRLVVSEKTHAASSGQAAGKIEFKSRKSSETELLSLEEIISKLEARGSEH
jgi:prolyl-tRNA synthetase